MTPRAKGHARRAFDWGKWLGILLVMGQLYKMSLENQQAADKATEEASKARGEEIVTEASNATLQVEIAALNRKMAVLERVRVRRADHYPPGTLVGPPVPEHKGHLIASAEHAAGAILGIIPRLFGLGKHGG